MDVRDVVFSHRRRAVSFARMFLYEFGHVKETLEISERVVRLALVDFSVELAFAGPIYASLIH